MSLRSLGCLVLGMLLGAAPHFADSAESHVPTLEVFLEANPEEGVELPRTARILVEIRGSGDPQVVEVQGSVPGKTNIPLPIEPSELGSISAEARVEAPGFWAPPRPLLVMEERSTTQLRLLPTGTLVAAVTVRDGLIPSTLNVRFRSSLGREESAEYQHPLSSEHSIECPVSEGRLRCAIPAETLDLRFRARGFVSVHRWGLDVLPHKTLDLGHLELRPGSSVVGWILADGDDFRPETATVELFPKAAAATRQQTTQEREQSLVHRTQANARGFFQLADVPAGSFRAVVRHPGFAPAQVEPILVREGFELELPDIHLARPLEIQLSIHPARDPFNKPWTVRLLRQGPMVGVWTEITGDLLVQEDVGTVYAKGLEPGLHRVQVTDSRGSSWHQAILDVQAGTPAHEIVLPYERLEATVRMADEPLRATVYFGGKNGEERIVARTDTEGKAYVFLPKRESWMADIESPALRLTSRVEGIRGTKEPGDPWAKAEIEVPDTRVFGVVVDELGNSLEGARVEIYAPERGRSEIALTGPDGRFELRGFNPGRWAAEAEHRASSERLRRHAPLQTLEVHDGEPNGPVRLVATPQHRLTGQVVAPSGEGIPGALVVPIPEQGLSRISRQIDHQTTEVDGSFTLWLPAGSGAVQLQIYPPGFAAQQLRVPLPRNEPIMVLTDPAGGTIVMVPETSEPLEGWEFHSQTALFGEFLFVTPALRMWAGTHGIRESRNRLVIPNLAPGHYTACFGVVHLALANGRLPQGAEPRCSEGFLAPGSELVLTVPVERAHSQK